MRFFQIILLFFQELFMKAGSVPMNSCFSYGFALQNCIFSRSSLSTNTSTQIKRSSEASLGRGCLCQIRGQQGCSQVATKSSWGALRRANGIAENEGRCWQNLVKQLGLLKNHTHWNVDGESFTMSSGIHQKLSIWSGCIIWDVWEKSRWWFPSLSHIKRCLLMGQQWISGCHASTVEMMIANVVGWWGL